MIKAASAAVFLIACQGFAAYAEDYSMIDPAQFPGKARFLQVVQAKFDKDHSTLFQTSPVKPEDEQAVFDCMVKSVLADMPDDDAARAADMIEGKIAPDRAMAKWFSFNKRKHPERYQQVVSRASVICPQFSSLLD